MPGNLAMPAARAKRNQWAILRNPMFREELLPVETRPDHPRQRMSDVEGRDASYPEETLLEGKDAVKFFYVSTECVRPAFSPCPGLWSHQIENRDTPASELACESEVKVRTVRQDCRGRKFTVGGREQLIEGRTGRQGHVAEN